MTDPYVDRNPETALPTLKQEIDAVAELLSDADRKFVIETIVAKVLAERALQIKNWGEGFDVANTANDWVAIIAMNLGRAVTYPWDRNQFEISLTKVCALALAAVENSMKAEGKMSKRHYDE